MDIKKEIICNESQNLGREQRIVILRVIKENCGIEIIRIFADGCRIDLSMVPDNVIEVIYNIVKNNLYL